MTEADSLLVVFFLLLILVLTNCGNTVKLNEFPKGDIKKVVAYKMTGEYGEIIENGKISNKITGKKETIEGEEMEALIKIFRDRSTYGNVAASCFEPHVAYIFYGKKDNMLGHATICLTCNWMKMNPDIGESIFSEKGAKKLAEIEQKIFAN